MKKYLSMAYKIGLFVFAIVILYIINVGSPSLNRAGQKIEDGQ